MTSLTRNLDDDTRDFGRAAAFFSTPDSVHTEITKQTGGRSTAGWLAYDDTCGFCVRWTQRVDRILARRRVELVPLSTPWVRERLGLSEREQTDRMWLLLPDGRKLGGADAAIELARRVWWAWPIAMIAGLPGIRRVMQRIYLRIAARRQCDGHACPVPQAERDPQPLSLGERTAAIAAKQRLRQVREEPPSHSAGSRVDQIDEPSSTDRLQKSQIPPSPASTAPPRGG